MATRDQERAKVAFEHVHRYEADPKGAKAKKYATMVHKLPALLQTAGLCQALHFASTRDEEQRRLVEDLAVQLRRVNAKIQTGKDLLERSRTAELGEYLQLTDEAMACAAWYRRLVQGVLKIEAADADGAD